MPVTYAVHFTQRDLPPSLFVAETYVVDDTNTLVIFRDEAGKELRAFPFVLVREIETRGYGVSLASPTGPQIDADVAVARASETGGIRPTPPRQPIESVAAAAAAGGPRG